MNKPAEPVSSLYAANSVELLVAEVGEGHLEVDAAVRALGVIVLHELPQHAVQVALAADQQPIEALSACCEHKPFRERVRVGSSNGGLDNSSACRAEYFVKWTN